MRIAVTATHLAITCSVYGRLTRCVALKEAGVLGPLILLVLLLWTLESASTEPLIHAVLSIAAFVGIVAIHHTILLIDRAFDASVGSRAGLAAKVSSQSHVRGGVPSGDRG